MLRRVLAAILALLLCASAFPQAPSLVTLAAGKAVSVRLRQPVSTRNAKAGDALSVEVLEDVTADNGAIVISKGAPVYGHVTEAQEARRLSRRGKLALVIDSAQAVTGEWIPLQAQRTVQAEGSGKVTMSGAAGAAFLFGASGLSAFFLLRHGNEAEIPLGTSFTVFVAKDAPLDPAKTQPPLTSDPLTRYHVAFVHGDVGAMQALVASVAGNPAYEAMLLSAQSDTEAYNGHLAKAREFTDRAVNSAVQVGATGAAAIWRANGALREAELGNAEIARQQADAALALSSKTDVRILAALALARAGDAKRADMMSWKLSKRFPLDTMLHSYWLPTIDAAVQLSRNNPAKCLEILRRVAPLEMNSPLPFGMATLYPLYLRGEALLKLHQGTVAAMEFRTIVEHPGLVVNFPLGALARLQLARAEALADHASRARALYADFLKVWEDADPDLVLLKQALQESAN